MHLVWPIFPHFQEQNWEKKSSRHSKKFGFEKSLDQIGNLAYASQIPFFGIWGNVGVNP